MNDPLKLYVSVGIGGALGAMGRYSVSLITISHSLFPWSTLTVNLIGSFLLTFILLNSKINNKLSRELFTGFTAGVLGSFTTFSTVTYETVELWQYSAFLAVGYVIFSFLGSLCCCFGAFLLSNRWQV